MCVTFNFCLSIFTPIQKILPKAIAAVGMTRETRAALICEKYRKLAPRFVHPEALNYTFPKFYKDKTLTVGVENSAWASQVMTKQAELVREINKSLGQKLVNKIQIRTGENLSSPI